MVVFGVIVEVQVVVVGVISPSAPVFGSAASSC
jgi:hypothetical protein